MHYWDPIAINNYYSTFGWPEILNYDSFTPFPKKYNLRNNLFSIHRGKQNTNHRSLASLVGACCVNGSSVKFYLPSGICSLYILWIVRIIQNKASSHSPGIFSFPAVTDSLIRTTLGSRLEDCKTDTTVRNSSATALTTCTVTLLMMEY